jgi:tripartite-type tricarboxylate transporter receptor subunit TctC
MPYVIERDLVPVYWSGSVMNALAVHPSNPATTLPEFITWARANQGRVNYGSSGFGSSNHLTPELLNGRLGLGLVHVPFRGGAPALQALLANQVQVMIENVPTKIEAIRSGLIRAIAVTGRERDPALPDVPTFAEAGVPDIVVEPWFGFMAPAGTPVAAVNGLNRILNEANADAEVQRRLRDLGVRPEGGSAERFASHVRAEVARWQEVVERNGIERLN